MESSLYTKIYRINQHHHYIRPGVYCLHNTPSSSFSVFRRLATDIPDELVISTYGLTGTARPLDLMYSRPFVYVKYLINRFMTMPFYIYT
jgi:hypothetical protein